MTDQRCYPASESATIREALARAIDSPAVEALARLFHPRVLVVGNSYSESIVDILAPRFIAELGSLSAAQPRRAAYEVARHIIGHLEGNCGLSFSDIKQSDWDFITNIIAADGAWRPPVDNPLKAYTVDQLQYEIALRASALSSTHREGGK